MQSLVIIHPGTNRHTDMTGALRDLGSEVTEIDANHDTPPPADLIVLPGGFSYGDYLRPGAIGAHAPIMAEIRRRAQAGVVILGVCNGFQILVETGLLPGAFLRNIGLNYLCRDVFLRVERACKPFTGGYRSGDILQIPVSHRGGNYVSDPKTLERLEKQGRILLRYCDEKGDLPSGGAVNGAMNHIAGVMNETGNVFGMMPHFENAVDPLVGTSDGRGLFRGLIAALCRSTNAQ